MCCNKKTHKFLANGEKTLNNTGYMTSSLDPYSQEFIQYAGKVDGKVADIGACYGIAVLPALEQGSHVIAVDNEPRHLEELRSRVSYQYINQLECVVGALPNNIDIAQASLSAILCCRVLHLLTGDNVELSLKTMHKLLKKGGKIFLITDSPYAYYSDKLLQEFTPIFEQKKAKNIRWPGFIPNLKDYLKKEFQPMAPEFVHLFDGDVLVQECEKTGFKIEKSGFIPRPDYPPALQNDGRENAGVIAVKI
ncbi:MAG: class I SAM-dependent methyltransferase [Gammaproteobacteria bacterium]|jgi:SAM-dependent methyltransferase